MRGVNAGIRNRKLCKAVKGLRVRGVLTRSAQVILPGSVSGLVACRVGVSAIDCRKWVYRVDERCHLPFSTSYRDIHNLWTAEDCESLSILSRSTMDFDKMFQNLSKRYACRLLGYVVKYAARDNSGLSLLSVQRVFVATRCFVKFFACGGAAIFCRFCQITSKNKRHWMILILHIHPMALTLNLSWCSHVLRDTAATRL